MAFHCSYPAPGPFCAYAIGCPLPTDHNSSGVARLLELRWKCDKQIVAFSEIDNMLRAVQPDPPQLFRWVEVR